MVMDKIRSKHCSDKPATGDIVAEGAYAGKKEAKKACCGRRCKKADRSMAS